MKPSSIRQRKPVEAIRSKLRRILDCCFDPLYQLGDTDAVEAACRRIGERLEERRINRIVTGCLNCRKILATSLSGIRVEFALDLLYEEIMPNRIPEVVFLHHPCSAPEFATTHKNIAERIGHHRRGETMPSLTACCGNGGAVPLLSKELADRFSRREKGSEK